MISSPLSITSRASRSVSQTLYRQDFIPHSQKNGSLPGLSCRTTAWIL